MKTKSKIVVLLSFASLLSFSPAKKAPENNLEPAIDNSVAIRQIEKQAFDLVNEHRKNIGLPALISKEYIADQARQHSKDMAESKVEFGHDGANSRLDIISKSLKEMSGGGENVFYCTGNYDNLAATAVDAWLKSPGHRENIEGDYNLSGMGVVQAANGDYYFTQIFVKGKE